MPLIATLGNNSKKTSVLLMLIFRVIEKKKIFKNVALKYYLGEYENNINDKNRNNFS